MKKPDRIDAVCKKNNYLQGLIKRAQWLNSLNIILQQALPTSFSAHCRLVNVHDDVLVVHTDNASHASLLRFQAKTLCKTFSDQCNTQFNKLEVKVRPMAGREYTDTNSSKRTNSLKLPAQAADTLKITAASVDDDNLKQALNKLANQFK